MDELGAEKDPFLIDEEAPRLGEVARHAVRVSAQPRESGPLEQNQGEPTICVGPLDQLERLDDLEFEFALMLRGAEHAQHARSQDATHQPWQDRIAGARRRGGVSCSGANP